MTVRENLLLGASRRAARPLLEQTLGTCLDAFPILAERRDQLAGSMSGGEQQMLALARAMMSQPRILIVDEPSVGLSPLFVGRIMDKIAELRERHNLAVLMAEQNFRQASRIADEGCVLVHGRIVHHGHSMAELRESDIVQRLYLAN
jgi:branched-chain amino acid transport system ATP-binding protein